MSSIIGKWEGISGGYTYEFEFKADGDFVSNAFSGWMGLYGGYKLDGDKLYITARSGTVKTSPNLQRTNETATFDIKLADNQLFIDWIDGSARAKKDLHLKRVRKFSSEGGCYVATCVYGTYDCQELWVLRRFRDDVLIKTWIGKQFIHLYYAAGPNLVKFFGEYKLFHVLCKYVIDLIVKKLRAKGVKNTPYDD